MTLVLRPDSTDSIRCAWTAPVESNITVRGYTLSYGKSTQDTVHTMSDTYQRNFTISNLGMFTIYRLFCVCIKTVLVYYHSSYRVTECCHLTFQSYKYVAVLCICYLS